MVRPSLLKLASNGALPVTAISAAPLLSSKLADGITALSKVSVREPGGTSGSCLNTMRNFPGSVAIIGFTGELKFITSVGGFVLLICAVKCTATLPMNNRRDVS
jgi:hypothetical protein